MNSLTVEDLGKRYLLGRGTRSAKARARLDLKFASVPLPWGKRAPSRELWALRHVSFGVERGSILGVIGPNGAGKSTLLKILARVVRPTEGRVIGRGRVVSLLELGAGFNVDLSARDNIFMNAAMQGIASQEVEERLDDIVEFAEVGDFLDNPLRHFSSGMYLRLAFAVAINMNPDILLADEILAVGDIAFQERCLQRVAEEGKKGLTVLFVSHDMAAIARLCDRTLWLHQGQTVQIGPSPAVVAAYQQASLAATLRDEEGTTRSNRFLEVLGVRLVSSDGRAIGAAPLGEEVFIRIRLKVMRLPVRVHASVRVYGPNHVLVFQSGQEEPVDFQEKGVYDILAKIPAHLLAETRYSITVWMEMEAAKNQIIHLPEVLTFMTYGSSYESRYKGGLVMPRLEWSVTTPQPDVPEVPVETGS